MSETVSMQPSDVPVEADLRAGLAQGDAVLGTIAPVLGHLLASHDHSLFSDEILSRVRGMVDDIAWQLLVAEAEARGAADPRREAEAERGEVAAWLLQEPRLVLHCHALALEGQLAARLDKRSAVDPVLSPLLQALIASDDAGIASTAMAALAAQARFVQSQRRMELPVSELPADLFQAVITRWLSEAETKAVGHAPRQASDSLRLAYDESASRLGLFARLVAGMGAGSRAALSISHAGVAVFLTALSAALRVDREFAAVTTNERQIVRLGLSLRAAGLKPSEVEEQVDHIHPGKALPEGFDMLRRDRAAALLAGSGLSRAS